MEKRKGSNSAMNLTPDGEWWSWRDLNPRPQAFFEQFYMCSRLIDVSPSAPRSDTLCTQPVPSFLAAHQGTR